MAVITQMIDALVDQPTVTDPTTFSARSESMFGTQLPTRFVQQNTQAVQMNALAAAMNAIAAGTALSAAYTFSTTTTDSDPGSGTLRLGSATQNAAIVMRVDLLDAAGSDQTSLLDLMDDSTSTTKGFIKLVKLNDPTKFLVFSVTGSIAAPSGYRNITIALAVPGPSASPFSNGDELVLEFSRTGDKGDTGAAGTLAGTASAAINWNTAQTIASATTTDIGAATSNYVVVSGTTTITGLGTIAQGAERIVRFSGALTLTHNATSLILPGSANITTAAGDFARFISDGAGNWRCQNYLKADGTPVVIASQAEATAGAENTKPMTALRVSQAITALAGSGITRVARSSNTILAAGDKGKLFEFSSTFTQTFTAAVTLGAGWSMFAANMGTGEITLDPNGSETIDGRSSFVMYPNEVRLITCDGSTFESIVLKGFEKTFSASGTFTKPPGYLTFEVELIGGGGGGGGGGAHNNYTSGIGGGSGGGGGACPPARRLASALFGATATVVIGAGGAGGAGASVIGGGTPGTSGGTTSITLSGGTNKIEAYGGGGGGGGGAASVNSGGSGAGVLAAGIVGSTSARTGGEPRQAAGYQAFGGGNSGYTSTAAEASAYGGGGGGGGDITNVAAGRLGANSLYGGAGGGAGGSMSTGGTAYQGNNGGQAANVNEGQTYGAGGSGGPGYAGGRRCGGGGGGAGNSGGGSAYAGGAGGIGAGGGGGGMAYSYGSSGAGGVGGDGELTIRGVI